MFEVKNPNFINLIFFINFYCIEAKHLIFSTSRRNASPKETEHVKTEHEKQGNLFLSQQLFFNYYFQFNLIFICLYSG